MKLCIPVAADEGMKSQVFGHFGSAPVFALHDTDADQTTFIDNAEAEHAHGACNPLQTVGERGADAILVGGIGARAVAKLSEVGIKVYRAPEGTLAHALDEWRAGRLAEITADDACSHHGGCAH